MYGTEELKEVQDMISGKRRLSESEIQTLKQRFGNAQIPRYLHPFLGLLITNPDLYRRLSNDERVKKYSVFGFFPETFELVYGDEVSPEISFDGGNRGLVGIIKHPKKSVVIKPAQSSREIEIANIADELEVGPRQYDGLGRFISEQFVEGELFSKLKGKKASDDNLYILGRRVGDILSKLHSREIYYNDTILSDDMGRSHIIVPETSPAILFDYGVAIRLNNHPNLSDEEVYNFARTLPMVGMMLGAQPSEEQVKDTIDHFRPKLTVATKEQIMARDINFINEGLNLAMYRLGDNIAEPFLKGFKETYMG